MNLIIPYKRKCRIFVYEGRKQLTISCVWNSLGKAASVPASLGTGQEVGLKYPLGISDTAKNLRESEKASM